MEQKEKEILIKELSARLPYGVIMTNIKLPETNYPLTCEDLHDAMFNDDWDDVPYLRQITSMTEEEKEEYFKACDEDIDIAMYAMNSPKIIIGKSGESSGCVLHKEIEFLLENHFDFPIKTKDNQYKTLTELGLAIKAPDGMYNIKEQL